ncbi:hypothetical protein F638_0871 [Pseudomonas sp. LAIL14HWK12:I2]|nr:hypothetical protein F638_0871 [Pseudomonas sp. LAIL14HWK12:I2]
MKVAPPVISFARKKIKYVIIRSKNFVKNSPAYSH